MPWKTVLRPEDTRSSGPAGYGMSSGRCLGFSTTLWAHGGTSRGPFLAMGSYWSPSLVAIILSSVALRWQHSWGFVLPSTLFPAWLHSWADLTLLQGCASPYQPPRSMHEAPSSGAAIRLPSSHGVQRFWALPFTFIPWPSQSNSPHFNLSQLAVFNPGSAETACPPFNHTPSHPCGVYRLMFIIRLPNTTLSPFLINPPLIPLPSHNGKAAVLEPSRYENTSGPP
jgi:hypothetical protein